MNKSMKYTEIATRTQEDICFHEVKQKLILEKCKNEKSNIKNNEIEIVKQKDLLK